MILLFLALGIDDGKPKAIPEKLLRLRTASHSMSITAPPNARRHLKGQFLCVRLPEFGKEYAHIKIQSGSENADAPDDVGYRLLDAMSKEKKLQVVTEGKLRYVHEDTRKQNANGGTMHAWVSTLGNELCVMTLVIEGETKPETKRKIVEEIAPKIVKSLRYERNLSHAGKNRRFSEGREDIIGVKDDDPGMAAAVAEAKATLVEFEDALKKPAGRDGFALKKKFEENDQVEWMWVCDLKAVAGGFEGALNSEPEVIKKVKLGDKIKLKRDDVADWMYLDNGAMVGGYSVRLLVDRMPPAKRKAMEKDLGIDN
jgi:uncharacterized protein YegJ (DUF2314 family)